MGDRSLIEWTDATWNPVVGCSKVSPGCDNCYAVRATARTRPGVPFENVVAYSSRLDQPLRWKRPRRIFVNSLSDLFHADVLAMSVTDRFGEAKPLLAEIFAVMVRTPRHVYQVLTKRAGIMAAVLNEPRFRLDVNAILLRDGHPVMPGGFESTWPENIWCGVSVEDQKWADIRIPKLLETPAAVRFLSCEPLLGPIDLDCHAATTCPTGWLDGFVESISSTAMVVRARQNPGIDWVIVGGESGPGARPMHPAWARSLRDQCVTAGVPFFFKQWGEWAPEYIDGVEVNLDRLSDWQSVAVGDGKTNHVRYTRVGKKRAGRELDGRTWDEMPRVQQTAMK